MNSDARGRWDARYRASAGNSEPAVFLNEVAHLLPESGSMLDIAGGAGRNALWFARRGFATTVVDISTEALALAADAARAGRLDIECINRDVEADGLPTGRVWDVALMHLFWNPDVLSLVPGALNPGGLLLLAQPTVLNLERHQRPGRRFLLELGELAATAQQMDDVEVLEASDGWRDSGRHEARLIARKPARTVTEAESQR